MKKLGLMEWSSIAEIVGTVAVVVSLLFVAYSVNRNTEELQGEHENDLYDADREIELALASDAVWTDIVRRGRYQTDELSESETFRYDLYVVQHLNLWEQMIGRHEQGLMPSDKFLSWDSFYERFVANFIHEDVWLRVKWNHSDPNFRQRVEAAMR